MLELRRIAASRRGMKEGSNQCPRSSGIHYCYLFSLFFYGVAEYVAERKPGNHYVLTKFNGTRSQQSLRHERCDGQSELCIDEGRGFPTEFEAFDGAAGAQSPVGRRRDRGARPRL